ncbi:MAG: acetolactate synthase [Acidobacteria bacterium]|nr:acetolactate synthase [Acidobacteriota bacterium]
MGERISGHGGDFVAEALRAHGIDRVFTLSGGHVFPIYDGLRARGMRIVDTRHEQAAAFAAEAQGKLTRTPGVAVLTAGPGVTNAMSAIAAASFSGSPMLVIAGRAPAVRWGQGSLQEIDHLPLVSPLCSLAETVFETSMIGERTTAALRAAGSRHRGPAFLDIPLEVLYGRDEIEAPGRPAAPGSAAPGEAAPAGIEGDLDAAARALEAAERPVLLLGSDVWSGGAEGAGRVLVESRRIPVFMNGMGRGIVPADHALAFAACRGRALARADLVIVAGTPLDFRLGFGAFGGAAVVHVADHPSVLARHRDLAAGVAGPIPAILEALAGPPGRDRDAWLAELRAAEREKRAGFQSDLRSGGMPIHPARVYGELVPRLARDAVLVLDGGDFVSYAGAFVEVFEPGAWLDAGPFGCLGTAPGYALAAGLLYPGRQLVVLLGDGAAGFGMGDWDTLVRFGIDCTIVCGNNGIWGLEKHPMRLLYGYDVAAELRPETRYDEVMRALGGHGELVRDPADLGAAFGRALATPGPSLVNVVTDPAVAYPRSSSLG